MPSDFHLHCLFFVGVPFSNVSTSGTIAIITLKINGKIRTKKQIFSSSNTEILQICNNKEQDILKTQVVSIDVMKE